MSHATQGADVAKLGAVRPECRDPPRAQARCDGVQRRGAEPAGGGLFHTELLCRRSYADALMPTLLCRGCGRSVRLTHRFAIVIPAAVPAVILAVVLAVILAVVLAVVFAIVLAIVLAVVLAIVAAVTVIAPIAVVVAG